MTYKTINSNKRMKKDNSAIIAYLTVIGLIIAFVMNSEKKRYFHKLPYPPVAWNYADRLSYRHN